MRARVMLWKQHRPLPVYQTRRHDNHNAEHPDGSSCFFGRPKCAALETDAHMSPEPPYAAGSAGCSLCESHRLVGFTTSAEVMDVTLLLFGPREYIARCFEGHRRLTG